MLYRETMADSVREPFSRFRLKNAVNTHARPADTFPIAMSRAEIALFDAVVEKSTLYLEFGSGGSTLRVLNASSARLYTVESDPAWIQKMESYGIWRKATKLGRLTVEFVDIGKTGRWGKPKEFFKSDSWSNYSSSVFKNDLSGLDCVLIDGRFRVACALNVVADSLRRGNNPSILIHDWPWRRHYHVLKDFLEVLDVRKRLALFRIKGDIDRSRLAGTLETYQFDIR